MEDLQNIELNASLVYDNRCGDKVYSNFRDLNVPEDGVKCKFFCIISIDTLFVYKNKYYLEVYLEKCAYKIVDKQMIGYLDANLFNSDEY